MDIHAMWLATEAKSKVLEALQSISEDDHEQAQEVLKESLEIIDTLYGILKK